MSTINRYQCSLRPELLEKAVQELNEPRNNSDRLEAIDSLREAFKLKNPEMKLMREDDLFFLAFLRARKFDQTRALQILENFHSQRENWSEIHDKMTSPVVIADFLAVGVAVPLSGKAKDGSTVVVGRPGIEKVPLLINFLATMLLTYQTLVLEDEETQISGVTLVQDLAYMSIEYAKQMTPAVARRGFTMIQDAIPLRLKGVHVTNEPKFFDLIFAIISPFLKEKLKKRFRIHGTDFTILFKEVVDRSVLPPMFAGNGPELAIEDWKMKLLGESTLL